VGKRENALRGYEEGVWCYRTTTRLIIAMDRVMDKGDTG